MAFFHLPTSLMEVVENEPASPTTLIINHDNNQPHNLVRPHEAFIAAYIACNARAPQRCENCGGDGGWMEPCGRFDVCPVCDGTGELRSSISELISLDDLDIINRDKPAGEPC